MRKFKSIISKVLLAVLLTSFFMKNNKNTKTFCCFYDS